MWVELVGEDSLLPFILTDTTDLDLPPYCLCGVPIVPPAGRSPHNFTPVKVNAVITKRGNVKRAWIVETESPYFNKAVLKSVVQRKYRPGLRHGVPIDTLITIDVSLR
jgi:hypothetical protein